MLEGVLLGENNVLDNFKKVVLENTSYIINIYGDEGVGKTSLINAFINKESNNYNFILIDDYLQLVNIDFSQDLNQIIVIDDVDEKINTENLFELISKTFIQFDTFKLIISSKSRFFTDKIAGFNIFSFELGCRNFSALDFQNYIKNNYSKLTIDKIILENIFLLATYIKNFNYIKSIFQVISNQKKNITQIEFMELIESSDLYIKLREEVVIEHNTDTKNNYIFNIRRKDPIEKLRDILIKYYNEESLLISVLKAVYDNSSFIDELFNMNISYDEKVMQLCFTYNPIELITKLLGVRDIINELKYRNVKTMALSISIEDKAKLLLKDIGLNILDTPKGIRYYKKIVHDNRQLVSSSNEMQVRREHLIGLGISCYQELENVFHEMLNFYSIYFCGSVGYLIELYNKEFRNYLNLDRLTYGNYIQLFRFINKLAKQEAYQIALFELNRKEAIPNKIIKNIEELSTHRQYFSHKNVMATSYIFLRKRLITVYELAIKLIDNLIEFRTFPEIIKIKEIIFDEYGRKLFVGYDDANNEIRFSISQNIQMIDIYMHYYVIRKSNSFAINPIIIPKSLDDNDKLFNNGEDYDKSSKTQFAQATKLIDMLDLNGINELLDIGCGNGKTTIELYKRKKDMCIDAFDVSESMISIARNNLLEELGDNRSINFFNMNALDLNKENKYDMIFSNAALHWICDSQSMYTKIFRALKPGGRIAIHQGGFDSYRGLHKIVNNAIEELNFSLYYNGWKYPIFYPQKSEMERLLRTIGFSNIEVISYETDGSEYDNLVEDFSNAGMLPYLTVLDDQKKKKALKDKYFELCRKNKIDKYAHRLYIFAKKE